MAAAAPAPQSAEVSRQPAEQETDKPAQHKCRFHASSEEWVDELRSDTHTRLCRTAAWLDGLFGDEHEFDGSDFTGKLSIGFRQDEADGFDPRLRVRIRTELPNVSNRLNAFIGRVEEDSYISNTETRQDTISTVGLRSTNDDEDEWLFGLGYRNPHHHSKGLDYSVGAKISSGFNPYAKIAHRYLFETGAANYWRTTQTVFWRRDEKFGVSSRLEYTKIIDDRNIFEWDNSAKYTEEAEQWEWVSGISLHHSFSDYRGISSRLYVRGEEKNPVSIPEYGVNLTYIRELWRPWLFVETGVDLRWEKELPTQRYENVVRFGLQFEMLLGDYYRRRKND
ncbi:MAG: hypothetical protein HKN50_05925 [Gammaproteobacteria bacterium]|nr:hypothetical protein [Gammaproteobacteria bacterium]